MHISNPSPPLPSRPPPENIPLQRRVTVPQSQIYRCSGESNSPRGGEGLKEAFSIGLGESVRSLEGGKVSTDIHPEIVACTFRGRVCSLTTQALSKVRSLGRGHGRQKIYIFHICFHDNDRDWFDRAKLLKNQNLGLCRPETPEDQSALESFDIDRRNGFFFGMRSGYLYLPIIEILGTSVHS